MATDTVTIAQFIKEHHIRMTAERTDSNPSMPDSRNMDHWKCVLTRKENTRTRRMTVYFSMGYGHNGKAPKAADVLSCIASDSATVENSDFEEFCSEFGYDSDSRKTEKTYKACEHMAKRLQNWLNSTSDYQQLLFDCERL